MRKFGRLTWLFLKTTVGSIWGKQTDSGKDSTWLVVVLVASLLIFFPSMMFMIFRMFGPLFQMFDASGHLNVAVGLALNMSSLVIFVLSMMAAPAIFYFARDVEYLLPLPIKPEIIIGAKFVVALLFEYVIALIIIVPMFAALWPMVSAGGLAVNTIITFLTLPILPLVYSTVLCMFMVAAFKVFRNPDKYSLFIGIVAMIFGIGFSMVYTQFFMVDAEAIYDMLMGAPAVFDTMNFVFANNSAAARALAGGGFTFQSINIGVTALALLVFFVLARVLYFRGVVGLSESGSSAKKMTRDEILKQTQGRSAFRSYLAKEMKLLMRSPTAFLNCVLSAVLVPVILAGSMAYTFVIAGDGDMLGELLAFIDFNEPRASAVFMVIMCALGIFVAGMTSITATSISREGRNFFVMKYLPVHYRVQLAAKAASGFAVIIPAIILILVPLQIFLRAPLFIFLGGAVLTLPGAVFLNYLGLLIDLAKPKLDWDNEQAAIKNNANVLIITFGGMGLAAIIGVVGVFLLRTPLLAFVVLFVITVAPAAAVYRAAMLKGAERLKGLH
ncbi:MAG: hypothetical protein FWB91_02570 [Defluviitaleaceae bacterium]|nr:hypothetical protein [Defluviitaleaceae bacterium]